MLRFTYAGELSFVVGKSVPRKRSTTAFDAVVLDNTALRADLRLAGVHFKVFFEGILDVTPLLAVPQVVLHEADRQFRERQEELAKRYSGLRRELAGLGHALPGLSAAMSFPFLDPKCWPVPVTVLPYPRVSHASVVARDLERRKPFNEKGQGYRDTLIWYSLLELLQHDRRSVALITANASDFADEGSLHPDLARDVPERATIRLFQSVEAFNKEFITPTLPVVESPLAPQLPAPAFSPDSWVDDHLVEIFTSESGRRALRMGQWLLRDETYTRASSVSVKESRQLKNGRQLLRLEVGVRVHGRLEHVSAETLGPGEMPIAPEGQHFDNEVKMSLELILDTRKDTIAGFDVTDIRYPWGGG